VRENFTHKAVNRMESYRCSHHWWTQAKKAVI